VSLGRPVTHENTGSGGSPKGNLDPLDGLVSGLCPTLKPASLSTYVEVSPAVHWITFGQSTNCHGADYGAYSRSDIHESLRHCDIRELFCHKARWQSSVHLLGLHFLGKISLGTQ
jgi:hypothetical protein